MEIQETQNKEEKEKETEFEMNSNTVVVTKGSKVEIPKFSVKGKFK